MAKVQQSDIEQFCQLYSEGNNYSQIAKLTGFSSSTVSKYVKANYNPDIEYKSDAPRPVIDSSVPLELPPIKFDTWKETENWGDLCVLDEDEIERIQKMWGGLRR